MTSKKLIVKVSSLKDSLTKFKDAWEQAERGGKSVEPIEILSFENASVLMKALSPKRLELLQMLHALEVASIRYLAKQLNRDYSNVHQDVKMLYQLGVILEKENKYYVPWESIVTEIPLCTARPKHTHRGRAAKRHAA